MDESKTQLPEEQQNTQRFLVFYIGENTFATPLLSTREVIEPLSYTEVPNTLPYFLGVANLRGEILGVVDLKKKFLFKDQKEFLPEAIGRAAVIIFTSDSGTLGIQIDGICGVEEVNLEDIETNPHIQSAIPQDYLIGIAKIRDSLVTVIDLKKILDENDMVKLKKSLAA